MKHTVMLTITSLLTILFTTFHLADDMVRGFSPGGLSNIPAGPAEPSSSRGHSSRSA